MYSQRVKTLATLVILVCFIIACAGPQTVKPYKAVKVTAETILYESRVLMNKGTITEQEFNKVRDVYDKLRVAQDKVINARKALITYHVADAQSKLDVAVVEATELLIELLQVAKDYKIDVGGGQ